MYKKVVYCPDCIKLDTEHCPLFAYNKAKEIKPEQKSFSSKFADGRHEYRPTEFDFCSYGEDKAVICKICKGRVIDGLCKCNTFEPCWHCGEKFPELEIVATTVGHLCEPCFKKAKTEADCNVDWIYKLTDIDIYSDVICPYCSLYKDYCEDGCLLCDYACCADAVDNYKAKGNIVFPELKKFQRGKEEE
jgi:hypothetical protein